MRLLVLTSCTGRKGVRHPNALTPRDFQKGPEHVARRERALADLLTPAGDLYAGAQHVRLRRGLRAWDAAHPREPALLFILSAGYGILPAGRRIAPYECTFDRMGARALRAWADRLNVPADFRRLVSGPYDLALLLLGDAYLSACRLDETVSFGGPTLLFCPESRAPRLPALPNLRAVPLGPSAARRFSCPLVALKGELTARLLERLAANRDLLPGLLDPATDVLALLDAGAAASQAARTPSPLSPRGRGAFTLSPLSPLGRGVGGEGRFGVIEPPPGWWDRPHRARMRYFMPDWDDQVDPDYDFASDTHSGGRGEWANQVYAHQLYAEPCYDGLLVSRVVAEKSKRKKALIHQLGVHAFLRVPDRFPVLGDCGAFGYVHEPGPPYTTDEIVDYYTRLGFDLGVSVDHLILASTASEKQHRYELTIHNADEFLKAHSRERPAWQPLGAVQGWDPPSYARAAADCVRMGYDYLALGGLVRTRTSEVLETVRAVRDAVGPGVRLHVFGLGRLRAVPEFLRLGVVSFDSTSYLRQAWVRTAQSYVLPHASYAALRIPESGKSFRAKRMATHAGVGPDVLRKLERTALRRVRDLARRRCGVDTCLEALLAYDRLVTSDRVDLTALYRRTLSERPWEQCGCAVCRACGVEVILFRGNNRNRRRGFHNTHVFYGLFQRILAGEPVAVPR